MLNSPWICTSYIAGRSYHKPEETGPASVVKMMVSVDGCSVSVGFSLEIEISERSTSGEGRGTKRRFKLLVSTKHKATAPVYSRKAAEQEGDTRDAKLGQAKAVRWPPVQSSIALSNAFIMRCMDRSFRFEHRKGGI